MGQKRKIYTPKYLEKINSGMLNTTSQELYERILGEYPKRIFSGQIIEHYDFYERKSYIVGGLSLLELKAFLKGREEQYELFERHKDEIFFVYGQDGNIKYIAC